MIKLLQPKTLPLLVALAVLNLPLPVLAEPKCALSGANKHTAITEICPFKNALARIKTGGLWGFIDSTGQVAIAPQFHDLGDFSEGFAAAQRDEKWGLIDKQGKWIVDPVMEEIGAFSGGLASAQQDGKAGFIDVNGKWVIPASYLFVNEFAGSVAVAHESHENIMLIDRSGRVVKRFAPGMSVNGHATRAGTFAASFKAPSQLIHVDGRRLPLPHGVLNGHYNDQHFIAHQAATRNGENVQLAGLVDMKGTWVIPAKFRNLEAFHGTLAIASVDGVGKEVPERFGLVNRKGSFVAQPIYKKISRQEDGRYHAVRADTDAKVDVINADGKLLFALDCGDVTTGAQLGVLLVLSGCEKTFLVHAKNGVLKVAAGTPEVTVVGNHVLLLNEKSEQDDRPLTFEIYNAEGRRVGASDPSNKSAEQGYDYVALLAPEPAARNSALALPLAIYGRFTGELAILTRGYELLTKPEWEYDSVLLAYRGADPDEALEGPLVVKGKGGFGAIDAKGNWVIPPTFDALGPFAHGVAFAQVGNQTVLLDARGKTIALPEDAYRFKRTDYMVLTGQSDKGVVVFDARSGAVTVLPEPETWPSRDVHGGLSASRKDEKWGLVNKAMAWIVAPVYDDEPKPLLRENKLIGWVSENSYPTSGSNGKLHGLLDPQGRELIKPRYSKLELDPQSDLLIATEDDYLQSVLSADGQVKIAPVEGNITALGDGWFSVEMASKHGVVDQRGEWIGTPGRHEPALDDPASTTLQRPYAITRKGAQQQLVDALGRVSSRAAPLELSVAEPSDWWWRPDQQSEDSAVAFYGFNFKERTRVPGKPLANTFSEGVIAFQPTGEQYEGKLALADDKGTTIGIYDYEEIGPMLHGMASVGKEVPLKPAKRGGDLETVKRYGFIDRSGKLAVPLAFDHVGVFSEKRATVVLDGGLALIDDSGRILLQGAWQCGRTPVLLDGKKKVLWPEEAKKVTRCTH